VARTFVMLTAVVLAFAVLGAMGALAALQAPSARTAVNATSLPPALRALEQKMEGLRVKTERYSETIRSISLRTGSGLKAHSGRTRYSRAFHVDVVELGEVSLLPEEGEIFTDADRRPVALAIGSADYIYSPSIERRDGGRPWVRLSGSAGVAVGVGPFFPYHGESWKLNPSGTGSYAELISLLATAVGNVTVTGPAMVDGQRTTEFTAVVQPASSVKGLSEKELASIKNQRYSEKIDVFLAESGLPVRVRQQTYWPSIYR
jgi:hypothetical protein